MELTKIIGLRCMELRKILRIRCLVKQDQMLDVKVIGCCHACFLFFIISVDPYIAYENEYNLALL